MEEINAQIQEQLEKNPNLTVTYDQEQFKPSLFKTCNLSQDVTIDSTSEIVISNKRDEKNLFLAILENSDFIKSLKSQMPILK
jgi:hypothetical protein